MSRFYPLRDEQDSPSFNSNDTLVIFGEVFQRGYINGLIEEAERYGMKIIYSTVGRRDSDQTLRPLHAEELDEKQGPLINVPLEAGFDLEPSSQGNTPVDQLKGWKLSQWEDVRLDFDQLKESRKKGRERFRQSVKQYLAELKKHLSPSGKTVFAHTMAGGFPRAKIVMPAANRVFKGYGDRYTSSEMFWNTDIGRLCDMSFLEVTGETLEQLIDLTTEFRQEAEEKGGSVSYVAYGYHGTEVLVGQDYHWQSYSPYLQGFAKLRLEEIAQKRTEEGLSVTVFNVPEILTNSSSIFLGVEVCLYPLLGALLKEREGDPKVQGFVDSCLQRLKEGTTVSWIMDFTKNYLQSEIIEKWSLFEKWPQHNGPEQMKLMRESSAQLIALHKNEKDLITSLLSEVVFKACGRVMLRECQSARQPVCWIGHDLVSRTWQ